MMAITYPLTSLAQISGQITELIGDTVADPDKNPDVKIPTGTITIKPNISPFVRAPSVPMAFIPKPMTLNLDSEGYIIYAGSKDIFVMASDDPNLNPQGWTWTVSFNLVDFEGKGLNIPSYDIQTFVGTVTDIFISAPVDTSPGVLTIQGPQGPAGPPLTYSNQFVSTNTTAGTNTAVEYTYTVSGTTTITIPETTGRTLPYHIRSVDGPVTVVAASGTIEGVSSFLLYPGESIDLYPVSGVWRIF